MCMYRMVGLHLANLPVSHGAFRILMCLAYHENWETGKCYPSQVTISNEIKMHRQNVNRLIGELIEQGFIEIVKKQKFTRDGGVSNSYKLKWEKHVPGGANVIILPLESNHGETPMLSSGFTKRDSKKDSEKNPIVPKSSFEPDEDMLGMTEEQKGPLEIGIDSVWDMASRASRKRSSKVNIRRALKARLNQGAVLDDMVLGWKLYTQTRDATKDDGDFQPGAHVFFKQERDLSFVAEYVEGEHRERAGPTPGAEERAARIIERAHRDLLEKYKAEGIWPSLNIRPPESLACTISDELLAEYGYRDGPHIAEEVLD